MRQGQQNRRGRGRGRKVQNNLTRNYESNGPDVKIRGTASHIVEKYLALARDAAASGDSVTGENYLQHAEHYHRIIMAAQTQQSSTDQSGEDANGAGSSGGRGNGPAGESDGKQGEEVTAEAAGGSADGKEQAGRGGRRPGNGSDPDNAGKSGEREPADAASEETPDEAVT